MARKLVKKLIQELMADGEGEQATSQKERFALSTGEKREIKRAQDRLRRSDGFIKEIARNKGIERLSLRGDSDTKRLTLANARYINNNSMFTKRGFKAWKKQMVDDTRLSESQIDYVLSQIDAQKMDFIQNSRLRYGSNPQLDYVLDTANEIAGRFAEIADELERSRQEIDEDIF